MATIGIHDTNPNKMTGHTRIALYDMSIEDLGERRAKRILHTTIQGAAKFLGTVCGLSIAYNGFGLCVCLPLAQSFKFTTNVDGANSTKPLLGVVFYRNY